MAFRRQVLRRAARLRRTRTLLTAGTLGIVGVAAAVGARLAPPAAEPVHAASAARPGAGPPPTTSTGTERAGRGSSGEAPSVTSPPEAQGGGAADSPNPGRAATVSPSSVPVLPGQAPAGGDGSGGGTPGASPATTLAVSPPTSTPTTRPTVTAGSVPAGCGQAAQPAGTITAASVVGVWVPCSTTSVFGAGRGIDLEADGSWVLVDSSGATSTASGVPVDGTWTLGPSTAPGAGSTPSMLTLRGTLGSTSVSWTATALLASGPPLRLHVTMGGGSADYERSD